MGQMQSRSDDKAPTEGKHHIHEPLKDRRGASFKAGSPMPQNPIKDSNKKGNPGRPV